MSGTPQSQFVELRDLSPLRQQDTSYSRTTDDDHHRLGDALDSDRTYVEHDDAQMPIIHEEKKSKIRRRKAWQEDHKKEKLTKAGMLYRRVKDFSFVTRWLVFIVPVAILIAIPIIVGAFRTELEIAGVRIVWFFVWIEVVWFGLWVSKLVARLLPYIFRFVVSVVSMSTMKYANVIKNLEVPLSLFAWGLVCLSTFSPIMTQNPTQRAANDTALKPWESIVAKILTAAFFSSVVYLAEKLIIQLIAIHFHKVQYELRITENKWAVQMLAKLLAHSRSMFPRFGQDFMEEDLILEPSTFTGLHQRTKGSRPGSTGGAVTPMQFVNGARRVFQVGAGLVGAVGQEVSGKRQINQTTYQIVVEALLYSDRCSALARRIWLSFVQEGNEALLPEDMLDVFSTDDQEQAEAAFTYFDEDLNGDVSLDEMQMKINEVAKERKAITASLKDTDNAIGRLDDALVGIVGIIAVFIFIALLDTSFKTLLATSATALLSLSFIFGTTCQEIMASLIFVFVKHPFDVSDRIVINGIQYIVQEMSLMFTILKRSDGTQVQAPNSLLNTLFIENIRRSSAMIETLTVVVDFATPFDKIEALREEMVEFLKLNSRDYQSIFDITILEFNNLTKMTLSMAIKHKANWQNDSLRAQRRNRWMCALALAIKKLEIVADGPGSGDPKNPFVIQSVAEDRKNSDADPFSTPATARGLSQPSAKRSSLQDQANFDATFGASTRPEEQFDVDLRTEGESERIENRLPFTIPEERDILLADEEERQGHGHAYSTATPGPPSQPPQDAGVARASTETSVLSNRLQAALTRTRTGRRSNSQRSRVRPEDLEAHYGAYQGSQRYA